MATNLMTCDVCGATWDPTVQNHRPGPDCPRVLVSRIKRLELEVSIIDAALKDTQQAIANYQKETNDRIAAIAKRVTLLEHPAMSKTGLKAQ